MLPLKISIIIPVKPGGKVKALLPLKHLEYPYEFFEILVAEGCRPSAQRNAAARKALGDVLYFLDDDSLIEPLALDILASRFNQDLSVAAVGGPSLTPTSDTTFQKAVGTVLSSVLGGGGIRNRYRKTGKARLTDDTELILCNLSFRRDIFIECGGLDERLYPNEENELMDRLKQAGKLLVHDPSLAVSRSQRPSYAAFVRQIFGYGRGRAEQFRVSRNIKIFTLLPSLFILYIVSVPFFPMTIYILPFLCYLILIVLFSVWEGMRCGRVVGILSIILYPTLHLCYGAGFYAGLFRPRYMQKQPAPCDISIRNIKEMGDALVDVKF